VITPVKSVATALFDLAVPNVTITATPPTTFDYCSPITKTINLTVGNAGSPVKGLTVASNLSGGSFNVSSLSANWSYNSGSGVFSYTGGFPTGFLGKGQTEPLSFNVTPKNAICNLSNGNFTFQPFHLTLRQRMPFVI